MLGARRCAACARRANSRTPRTGLRAAKNKSAALHPLRPAHPLLRALCGPVAGKLAHAVGVSPVFCAASLVRSDTSTKRKKQTAPPQPRAPVKRLQPPAKATPVAVSKTSAQALGGTRGPVPKTSNSNNNRNGKGAGVRARALRGSLARAGLRPTARDTAGCHGRGTRHRVLPRLPPSSLRGQGPPLRSVRSRGAR